MGLNCRAIHDYIALPLVPIVQEIGLRGLPLDLEGRAELLERLNVEIMNRDMQLSVVGIEEPDSPRRLGLDLRTAGVPLTQMTDNKTQYKTDLEVLGRLNWQYNVKLGLEPRFPFLTDLIQRSKLAKARENASAIGVCDDGIVRTALKACHTKSARYASSGFGRKGRKGWCPACLEWGDHGTNLQNITRGCALCGSGPKDCKCEGGGVHIKRLFRAWPGWKLGELDYKALELFIMAYRIGCEKLLERLLTPGRDAHREHAEVMFPRLEITKKRRTLAKNFIYAIRGAGGDRAVQIVLSKAGEYVELAEIAQWRARIFMEYPEIPRWIASTEKMLEVQQARGQRRVIRNAFGRPRVLLGHNPLKEALATEISGTGAEVMNCVLLRLAHEQPRVAERIAMQIHDSFIVHAPEKEFDGVMAAVKAEMERPVWHGWQFPERIVAYQAECKAGERWGEMDDWKEAA